MKANSIETDTLVSAVSSTPTRFAPPKGMLLSFASQESDGADHDHTRIPIGLRVYYDATLETPKPNDEDNDGSVIGISPPSVAAHQAAVSAMPLHKRMYHRWLRVYHKNSFLILVSLGILLAYAYPPLGAVYVQPHITAKWIAVIFIFLMAGMGIKTDEFAKAFQRVYFNAYVQIFDFVVCSAVVYGFSRFMLHVGALPVSLADGMTICSTLSVSVNMGIVLTKVVGGDEAAAVFDAAFGNFLGVFVSPALILMYLGLGANINLGSVVLKLFLRVVLPLLVGQILRNFSSTAKTFVNKYGKYFRDAQEYCLAFIVYTIFCKTFSKGSTAKVGDVFIMIGCVLLVLSFLMTMAWTSLRVLFGNQPKLVAMGLFGCTHKTVAVGLPLVETIYADDPNLALYVLPLLIWYTTQLILGTAAAPYITAYIIRREKELEESNRSHLDTVVEMVEEGNAPTNVAIPPSPSETIESNESGSASDGTALKQDLEYLKEDREDGVSHSHPEAITKVIEPVTVTNGNA